MVRVTADSNIYISAILFGGLPLRFLNAARAGGFRLVISDALAEEFIGVLRQKFFWSDAQLAGQRAELSVFTERVHPTETLHVIEADPDDDRVLECAVAADCQFIVTGDKHLLAFGA